MSASDELLARRERVVPRAVASMTRATAHRGSGARVTDVDGNEWIDFAAGIGVTCVGHAHPSVVRAVQEQAERLLHTCFHVATYEPYVALCEKLVELFPHGRDGGEATKAALVNTGAEAVENAVKVARQATGRQAVICFTGGFPRAHLARDDADLEGRLQAGLRSVRARGLPAAVPQCLPRRGRTLRGGLRRARDAPSPARVREHRRRGQRRRGDRRARTGRGRLRPRADELAPGPARGVRRARHPPDLRRGAERVRPHGTLGGVRARGASAPTSPVGRRGWAAGCRSPRSSAARA